jgi:HD-like signal output (HDOD) protein
LGGFLFLAIKPNKTRHPFNYLGNVKGNEMDIVSTTKLKEDMVLSDDVKDINGRLLLGKGKKIESSHIRMLKMWGITEVTIVGNLSSEENSEPHEDPQLVEKFKENTKDIFGYNDLTHPAMEELFRLSVEFRLHNNILAEEKNIILTNKYDVGHHKQKDLRSEINRDKIKLPEIPSIVFELNEVIANPLSTADHISKVVNKSPSLAALLLKIVNSSFYGLPSRIDSLSKAVALIGTKEIAGLAIGISTITIFKDIPKEIIDMHSFLKHSFACGIVSRALAAHKNMPNTEHFFVSGLLHDIGRLVIYQYLPEQAKTLLNHQIKSNKLLYQEERSFIGYTHTDIGRYLTQKWKLTFELENNVFYHHNPSSANNPVQTAIIHLADIFVNALGIGSSGERSVPPLDYKAWDYLDISPSSFEGVIRQATHQFFTFDTFLQGYN